MVDLAYTMMSLMKIMDRLEVSSFEVCSPLSYCIINDERGMFTVFEALHSLFNMQIWPLNRTPTLTYILDGEQIPSEDDP